MCSDVPPNMKNNLLQKIASFALLLALILVTSPLGFCAAAVDEETEMGKTASVEVAKQYKFVEDKDMLLRLERVGNAIAAIAASKEIPATYGKPTLAKFTYSFKVIDDPEVNAFALPAGYIYVNKGLLDFIQSDDELAGVLSHEISHVAHHHLMQLIKAQQKQNTMLALAMLVGVTAGTKGESLGGLWQALTLIRIAQMSAYSQDAEYDADRTAVAYLTQTKYNPVGVLTSMERLAKEELRKPQVNYGIFNTHPASGARAKEIIAEMDKRGIPINRRMVTSYVSVQVKPVPDTEASSVCIGDIEIARIADFNGQKSAILAERIAAELRAKLIAGAQMRDVRTDATGQSVVILGDTVFSPTPADAALAGKSIQALATDAANAVKRSLLKERLEQNY